MKPGLLKSNNNKKNRKGKNGAEDCVKFLKRRKLRIIVLSKVYGNWKGKGILLLHRA